MLWVLWDDFVEHFTEVHICIAFQREGGVTKLIEGEWLPGNAT